MVPAALAAVLGAVAVTVLVRSSRLRLLQGSTLDTVVLLGVLVLLVIVAATVWAAQVARAASSTTYGYAAASMPAQVQSATVVVAPHAAASPATSRPSSQSPSVPAAADQGVFVHLSQRLQSLVHRQIQLLDTLENDVEEPDLLKGLFGVDHLATRMRRHAENLAVLGGAVPRRQWTKPVSIMEVLRSAVSETLDYARVQVIARTPGSLNGYAVADVIHLLAELVENATTFSPPETKVVLRTQAVTAGLAVEIDDRGLGMTPQEYERINSLLREPAEVSVQDLLQGARIGLYVVAQLARRHNIAVQLQTNITGGTQALVVLPKSLLAEAQREYERPMLESRESAAPAPAPTATPAAPPTRVLPPTPAPVPTPPPVSVPVPAPMAASRPESGMARRPIDPPPTNGETTGISARPAYGIDGALPAPRRAADGPTSYRPPQPPSPPQATAPAQTDQPPTTRPPLPHRRPQEHLNAQLAAQKTASNPADRVGDGLTPGLMADFRQGFARGSVEPMPGETPRENAPNQEGNR